MDAKKAVEQFKNNATTPTQRAVADELLRLERLVRDAGADGPCGKHPVRFLKHVDNGEEQGEVCLACEVERFQKERSPSPAAGPGVDPAIVQDLVDALDALDPRGSYDKANDALERARAALATPTEPGPATCERCREDDEAFARWWAENKDRPVPPTPAPAGLVEAVARLQDVLAGEQNRASGLLPSTIRAMADVSAALSRTPTGGAWDAPFADETDDEHATRLEHAARLARARCDARDADEVEARTPTGGGDATCDVWLRDGRTVYTLRGTGSYRKGVEQQENRLYFSVQRANGVDEAEAEAVAERIQALLNTPAPRTSDGAPKPRAMSEEEIEATLAETAKHKPDVRAAVAGLHARPTMGGRRYEVVAGTSDRFGAGFLVRDADTKTVANWHGTRETADEEARFFNGHTSDGAGGDADTTTDALDEALRLVTDDDARRAIEEAKREHIEQTIRMREGFRAESKRADDAERWSEANAASVRAMQAQSASHTRTELDLEAARAEVARLRANLEQCRRDCGTIRRMIDEHEASTAEARRLRGEVERLTQLWGFHRRTATSWKQAAEKAETERDAARAEVAKRDARIEELKEQLQNAMEEW